MNLLILTWLFPPSTGGVETYTYNLAKNLSKKHNVSVLTMGKSYFSEKKEKFDIYRIKEMYPYKSTKGDCAGLSDYLKNLILLKKITLVHSHNLICLPTNFSSTIIDTLKELHVPLIDHCHDARYKNLNGSLAKENLNIIAISQFAKRRLISLGYNENNIRVINNSADSSMFNPNKYSSFKCRKYFQLPLNKLIILFPSRAIRTTTGKFGKQKNFSMLLNSAKFIKKVTDNFLIVFPIKMGSKENKIERKEILDRLKNRLKKENLLENFFWIDRTIAFKEMPKLYCTADIVCTPSINEAFGLVFLESMLMKIPPIGARSGATPEIIKNGKTGFLVKPGDTVGLAKIIIKLIENKKLREKIGKNARKYAIKNFSNKHMINELKKLYSEVLRKK